LTCAPGITAPVGSVTTPETWAPTTLPPHQRGSRRRVTPLRFSQLVVNTQPIEHKRPKHLTRNAKFKLGDHYMRSKGNNSIHNSSEFTTFLADFGIPIQNSALSEPSTTIVSDFGNGTVSQNA
jgi:hypothetical protein